MSFLVDRFVPFRQDNITEALRYLLNISVLRQEMRQEICSIFTGQPKGYFIQPSDLYEHTDLERVSFLGLPKTWDFSIKDEGVAWLSIPTTVFFLEKEQRQEIYQQAVAQYIIALQEQSEDLQKKRTEELRQEYLRLHEIFGKENLTKKQGETK